MRSPRKVCVCVYVHKNIFSFKGKVQEKLEGLNPLLQFSSRGLLTEDKQTEKHPTCKWALLFENYFLSSPYI